MRHASRLPLRRVSVLALGIIGALAAGSIQASGFQLKENSVKAMGSAFAGAAVNEGDTSVVVNNPAVMTRFQGATVRADVHVIDLGFRFEGGGGRCQRAAAVRRQRRRGR